MPPLFRPAHPIVALGLVLALALFAAGCSSEPTESAADTVNPDTPGPTLTGADADQAASDRPESVAQTAVSPASAQSGVLPADAPRLDLGEYKALVAGSAGRVLLVCIWSVNCPACQQELPELEKLADVYPDDELRLVYASVDTDPQVVRDFFADYDPIGEVILVDGDVAQHTGAEYIPRLVIYDPAGKVSFMDSGFYPQAMLRALVERAAKAG